MTYFLILVLVGINFLFILYSPKSEEAIKKELTYNKINSLKLSVHLANILTITLNIIYIYVGLITTKTSVTNPVVDVASLIIQILSYGLFIITTSFKTKYKVIKEGNVLSTLYAILVIMIMVGDRKITAITSILPIIFLVCIFAGLFITVNESFKSIRRKNVDIQMKRNLIYFLLVSFIVVTFINAKLPYSYVAFIILAILVFLVYLNKLNKIANEKNKLKNTIASINEKPGIEYAFSFYKDIITTEEMFSYWIVYVIAIILNIVLHDHFFFIGLYLILIVLNIRMVEYKRLVKTYYSLSDFENPKYQMLDNLSLTIVNQRELLVNQAFDKVVYLVDNKIYISDLILYKIEENELDKIKLVINNLNSKDYLFVIGDIYD